MRQAVALLAVAAVAQAQVPSSWKCDQSWYGGQEGCDCECGAVDPDCADTSSTLYCGGRNWYEADRAVKMCVDLKCVDRPETPVPAPVPTFDAFDLMTEQNLAAHRTQQFYTTVGYEPTDVLVLRRGARFSVKASAAWNKGKPSVSIGGVAVNVVAGQGPVWEVEIDGTFAVGRGELLIGGQSHGTVTVLFNPYSRNDKQAYVGAAAQEYVENEFGRYWFGNVYGESLARGAGSSGWAFGQYDVLNYVVELVDKIPEGKRGDARLVARELTWLLNNAGNSVGVLHGRWDGEYSDGKAPWVWTGSREILKQWSESGQRPVRYGQCWVFACLLTTTLRTLGIASRPVTNFRSAHESKPFDFLIDEQKSDSIWNFHAWVDAAITRDDVQADPADNHEIDAAPADDAAEEPKLYWNAVDATPQETSSGRYQMGPAALWVMAKNLDHEAQYDTKFVVSETNGIVVRNGRRIYNDVGRYISTKKPGCSGSGHICREDITKQYKLYNSPLVTGARSADAAQAGDERLTQRGYDKLAGFSLGAQSLEVGGDVVFYVRSLAGVPLDGRAGGAEVRFTVHVVSYTGVMIGDLTMAGAQGAMSAAANPDATVATLRIPESAYRAHMGKASTLRVTAEVRNMIGMLVYEHTDKFELAVPQPEVVKVEGNKVVLKLSNPLGVPLTNGRVSFTAPAGDRVQKVHTIAAYATETVTLSGKWCNREHGSKKVIFGFSAAELGGNMHTEADIQC